MVDNRLWLITGYLYNALKGALKANLTHYTPRKNLADVENIKKDIGSVAE